MREKEPQFIVTDRRKFTSEGELRDDKPTTEESAPTPPAPATPPAPQPVEVRRTEPVEMRASEPVEMREPQAVETRGPQPVEALAEEADLPEGEEMIPEPTAAESAQQSKEYQASSSRLDEMLRKANPGQPVPPAMNFERLLQSLYMTAAVQMGAGTAPNEQPRIDILGARQSIDMLTVVAEKTAGNLSDEEKRMLQNALFDLRMSFLEITNAIANSAPRPPQPGKLH